MTQQIEGGNMHRKLPYMFDEEYFNKRLQEQIDWYDRKASLNQKKYKGYKRYEFFLAASIPVVVSVSTMGIFENTVLFTIYRTVDGVNIPVTPFTLSIILQLFAALAGVLLVIFNKMLELEEFYKNWKDYRETNEILVKEKILYLTNSEPYNTPGAFNLFVKNIEDILAKQVQAWKQPAIPQPVSELVLKAQESLEVNAQNIEEKAKEEKEEFQKKVAKLSSTSFYQTELGETTDLSTGVPEKKNTTDTDDVNG